MKAFITTGSILSMRSGLPCKTLDKTGFCFFGPAYTDCTVVGLNSLEDIALNALGCFSFRGRLHVRFCVRIGVRFGVRFAAKGGSR
jgi:hypothetical protein